MGEGKLYPAFSVLQWSIIINQDLEIHWV